ncbi:low affinity iron permease family protein [Pseudomonas sp. 57B-090624]|uniref:low affinity iron permease family protein n=1 Tax=Pseudomonas sp. 57B-090624 TaxID=2213080 RepID=UPI000DA8EEB9|nr:low affinity iron permease family protein [Pseudomonas sp. 57B-090624]PZE13354.1 low affinity iron permease family protein [Pseudomonas sp. 57B-090624]
MRNFETAARWLAERSGSPRTFGLALGGIALWGITGPFFYFNDTWQLIVNTSTTIITFLMVFLLQNTQNRDTDELHIKLDELLRATKGAQAELMALDDRTASELKELRERYVRLGKEDGCETSPCPIRDTKKNPGAD